MQERTFFLKIKQAITANPFSGDRLTLDLELTGMSVADSKEEILAALVHKVEKIVDRFLHQAGHSLDMLSEEDAELIRFGMLFRAFHVFCDRFDDHIREQIEKGDVLCKVPFAGDFFTMLEAYGFPARDSSRFFSLFFQMRRAYFFISRIKGKSDCVKELRKRLWNNIFTSDIELYERYLWNRLEDFSTMLLGETGTGKGLAAAAIGRSGYIPFDENKNSFSESFAKSFISINLSQFPEQLIESELFGHKRGAFTGAVDAHKGVFSRCSPHGAIFLDELGDVSVPVQVKLLQVLQERTFSPVGSRTEERFNGRVIGATNKSLDTLRQQGAFRDDFYYRLCSDVIEVPSLRQRLDENPEEIQELLSHIIARVFGKPSAELSEQVAEYISRHQPEHYPWKGNIRELEQCVRRILISGKYSWSKKANDGIENLAEKMAHTGMTAQQLLSQYCTALYSKVKTYEGVAKITDLDRRTVKKYIQNS